jgi:hypothetical protein
VAIQSSIILVLYIQRLLTEHLLCNQYTTSLTADKDSLILCLTLCLFDAILGLGYYSLEIVNDAERFLDRIERYLRQERAIDAP